MRIAISCLVVVLALSGGLGGCALGCPTALAQGVFVADGDELALRGTDGEPHGVRLPNGYRVERAPDGLVLVDFFGTVKAREGDVIQFGGGDGDDGRFAACEFLGVVPD
jgi:hypothetical protein